jgi:hypothetical protein
MDGSGGSAARNISAGQKYEEGCESGRIGRSRKPLSLRAPWVQIPLPPQVRGTLSQVTRAKARLIPQKPLRVPGWVCDPRILRGTLRERQPGSGSSAPRTVAVADGGPQAVEASTVVLQDQTSTEARAGAPWRSPIKVVEGRRTLRRAERAGHHCTLCGDRFHDRDHRDHDLRQRGLRH